MIESKLVNCYIDGGGNPYLFCGLTCVVIDALGKKLHDVSDPALVVANLEDCAIIPCAEYERLCRAAEELEATKKRCGRFFRILDTSKAKIGH